MCSLLRIYKRVGWKVFTGDWFHLKCFKVIHCNKLQFCWFCIFSPDGIIFFLCKYLYIVSATQTFFFLHVLYLKHFIAINSSFIVSNIFFTCSVFKTFHCYKLPYHCYCIFINWVISFLFYGCLYWICRLTIYFVFSIQLKV